MTITGLQPQKRNKDRVNVFIDDEYAFSLTLDLGFRLKVGQKLTAHDIEEFKRNDTVARVRQLSFSYLSRRPRSISELRNYLLKKGFDPVEIDEVIGRLEERDYLDDKAFARYWIEQRLAHSPRGIVGLRYELAQKGVSPHIIDEALRGVDEKEAAISAIKRKSSSWKGLTKDQFRRKIKGFLERRGFSYETIYEVADTTWLSLEESPHTENSSR